MSRKRKDSSQSTTLLDYFHSNSKRTRQAVSKNPSKPTNAGNDEDVIIISSDIELEIPEIQNNNAQKNLVESSFSLRNEDQLNRAEPAQEEDNFFDNNADDFPDLHDIPNDPLADQWDLRDDEGVENNQEDGAILTEFQTTCEVESRRGAYETDNTCPICMTSLKGLLVSVRLFVGLGLAFSP